MKKLIRNTILLTIMVMLSNASSFGGNYIIDSKSENDTVNFKSTAKLEFIEGTTNNLEGGFSFEPDSPNSEISGILKVDLRTLETGIDKRDEHMRKKHLHTDKFPFAFFELETVTPGPDFSKVDSTYTATATGKFYIHGVYRVINPELEMTKNISPSGVDYIQIRAKFSINLDNFKIDRPKALFLKLAETIEVEVIFTAFESKSLDSIELPDWSKLD